MTASQDRLSVQSALELLDLMQEVAQGRSSAAFAQAALPAAARIVGCSAAFLYAPDLRTPSGFRFFDHGLAAEARSELERRCAELLIESSNRSDPAVRPESAGSGGEGLAGFALYPLVYRGNLLGVFGVMGGPKTLCEELFARLPALLACSLSLVTDRGKTDRQLANLGTYVAVSSTLARCVGLHELLDTVLYCSMEAASAEAASVLLLDEAKSNFCFYHVEGPAKPVLMAKTFPSDKGIAGFVLRSQSSQIIQDVHGDSRFYPKIDLESGFQTRNMIALPLTVEEEHIGVLEVLNKTHGGLFTREDEQILLLIAEEIAFSIRNAKLFEYVVNSYCKQRQGANSCKGCTRPLGSWTPCVRYREAVL